ncbi:hypothetical protein JCM3774_003917 [Rhodotorula dairenensis]
MADNELDPAFLDLELPAHSSTLLLSSSLGVGFGGSSLDINDRLEHDSFEAQLGAGFGTVLDDELGDLHLGPGLLGQLEQLDVDGLRSVHLSSRQGEDGASSSSSDDAGPSRMRSRSKQKRARVRTERQHQSLASELASVARPVRRERALLHEFGLEDDDERDAIEPSDPSEDDSEGSLGRRSFADAGRRPSRRDDGLAHLPARNQVAASPRRQTARNGVFGSSASLKGELDDSALLAHHREAEQDVERIRAVERDLEALAAELSASSGDILAFMSRLNIHVGVSPDHTDRLSEPDNSTAAAAVAHSPFDYRDRQGVVEDLCLAFLRALHSAAAKRSEHSPGLMALEREVARTDSSWQLVLAALDPLPHDLFEDDPPDNRAGKHRNIDAVVVTDDNNLASRSPPQRSVDPSTLARDSATTELALLRSTTQSLLSTLASVAEQTQVQSALTSDAGRKLRALRTQLGTLRDEVGGVERSAAFVEAYEARQQSPAHPTGGDSAAVRARREVEEVQRRLDLGWIKAQAILTGCA